MTSLRLPKGRQNEGYVLGQTSFSSPFAPTKFVPWSLQMVEGLPRRATNRRKAEMKAAVVKSDTGSMCTALTVKETKRAIYALVMIGLRIGPNFIIIGSA